MLIIDQYMWHQETEVKGKYLEPWTGWVLDTVPTASLYQGATYHLLSDIDAYLLTHI